MIKNFLFDLDNTIYPSSSKINFGIDKRMIEAVSEVLSIDMESAKKLRLEKKKNFSSTLEWLMEEHNFTDINWYMHKVHPENEVEELSHVEGLKDLFESFKKQGYKMSILTNGPAFHAERVLDFYGLSDFFSGIHDIIENEMKGKPYPSSYYRALEKENFLLEETLFLDDYAKYVAGFCKIGGKSVLIDAEKKFSKEEVDILAGPNGFCKSIGSVFELSSFLIESKENLL